MFPGFDKLYFYLPKLSISGDQQHQMCDAITGSSFDYKNNCELLEFAVLLMLRKSFFIPSLSSPAIEESVVIVLH